mgnify:CR=1 FL=1
MTRRRPALVRLTAAAIATAVALVGGCGGSDGDGGAASEGTGSPCTPSSSADYLQHPEDVPDLIRERFGEAPSVRRINLFRESVIV